MLKLLSCFPNFHIKNKPKIFLENQCYFSTFNLPRVFCFCPSYLQITRLKSGWRKEFLPCSIIYRPSLLSLHSKMVGDDLWNEARFYFDSYHSTLVQENGHRVQCIGPNACVRTTNICGTSSCKEFSYRYTVILLNALYMVILYLLKLY